MIGKNQVDLNKQILQTLFVLMFEHVLENVYAEDSSIPVEPLLSSYFSIAEGLSFLHTKKNLNITKLTLIYLFIHRYLKEP